MDRRAFLQSVLTGSASLSLGDSAWAAVSSTNASPSRRLVVVFMRGAVDGLSVVVPYTEPNYYRLRSTVAIGKPGSPDGSIDLDGRFGLHPALAPLMPFWRNGSLAFVHASGSPDPTRSHFDGQDNIESGAPGSRAIHDGWLNRLEGALPASAAAKAAPTRGISVGALLPRIFMGQNRVVTIASGDTAVRPTVLDRSEVNRAFAAIYHNDATMGPLFSNYVATRGDVIAAIKNVDPETAAANNGAPSTYAFVSDAARLGTLMRRDPRVQLGFLAVSGWDTHANQGGVKGQLAGLFDPFAQGLAALAQNLGPAYKDTVIVVISEFGRTVAQNGNAGTDHGYGNVMWLMGGSVAGGRVHGEWPGLDDKALFEGRDLDVTTDFRDVLAQISERHLGVPDRELATVFPSMPKQRLGSLLLRA